MSNNWNKHLGNMVAIHSRAKTLSNSIDVNKLLKRSMSPSEVLEKQTTASDAKKLFQQAYRMCSLLIDHAEEDNNIEIAIKYKASIEKSISRLNFIIKMLEHRATQWGLTSEDDDESSEDNTLPDNLINQFEHFRQ